MSSANSIPYPLLHLLCDFSVESPDFTISQALLAKHFPNIKCVVSPQKFKKGHILAQSVFLKLVVSSFPDGTIHICRVGTMSKQAARFIVAKSGEHYFMGPDNGLLPLYFGDSELEYFNITPRDSILDPLKHVYIPAIEKLIAGDMILSGIFDVKETLVRSMLPSPTLSNDTLNLTVIYIDYYGNVYFNLDRKTFIEVGQGRNFKLRINSNIVIQKLSSHYNDVNEGNELCLFGHGDILQVAVNSGSAEQYLGLGDGRNVIIQFAV